MTALDDLAGYFADNPERRAPCVLVLDTSGSMSGAPIQALNSGLQLFVDEVKQDPLASVRCELAVVTFGRDGVQVAQDFLTVDQVEAPVLATGGVTPMGQGLMTALDLVENRVTQYKQHGIPNYRPWVFLMTDGGPTDDITEAAQRIQQLERARSGGIVFFGVGVGAADMQTLSKLSARPPVHLEGLGFQQMFLWLSSSQKSVTNSRPEDPQVPLPPLDWGTIQNT